MTWSNHQMGVERTKVQMNSNCNSDIDIDIDVDVNQESWRASCPNLPPTRTWTWWQSWCWARWQVTLSPSFTLASLSTSSSTSLLERGGSHDVERADRYHCHYSSLLPSLSFLSVSSPWLFWKEASMSSLSVSPSWPFWHLFHPYPDQLDDADYVQAGLVLKVELLQPGDDNQPFGTTVLYGDHHHHHRHHRHH